MKTGIKLEDILEGTLSGIGGSLEFEAMTPDQEEAIRTALTATLVNLFGTSDLGSVTLSEVNVPRTNGVKYENIFKKSFKVYYGKSFQSAISNLDIRGTGKDLFLKDSFKLPTEVGQSKVLELFLIEDGKFTMVSFIVMKGSDESYIFGGETEETEGKLSRRTKEGVIEYYFKTDKLVSLL